MFFFSSSSNMLVGNTQWPWYLRDAHTACFPFNPFSYASINCRERVANFFIIIRGMLANANRMFWMDSGGWFSESIWLQFQSTCINPYSGNSAISGHIFINLVAFTDHLIYSKQILCSIFPIASWWTWFEPSFYLHFLFWELSHSLCDVHSLWSTPTLYIYV